MMMMKIKMQMKMLMVMKRKRKNMLITALMLTSHNGMHDTSSSDLGG